MVNKRDEISWEKKYLAWLDFVLVETDESKQSCWCKEVKIIYTFPFPLTWFESVPR